MSLGNEIAAARRRVGQSQEQLAHTTGVSVSTISNYERGLATPKRSWLIAASALLDYDLLTPAGHTPLAQDSQLVRDINQILEEMGDRLIEVLRRHTGK